MTYALVLLVALAACDAPAPEPGTPAGERKNARERKGKTKTKSKSKSKGKAKARPPGGGADKAPAEDVPFEKVCDVTAFLKRGKGEATLRQAPAHDAAPGKKLPRTHIFTRLTIDGNNGEWVHVKMADVAIPGEGGQAGPIEGASGWLPLRAVDVSPEACTDSKSQRYLPRLFGDPSPNAEVVATLTEGQTIALTQCHQTWWGARTTTGEQGLLHEGHWCDHPETNCIKACDAFDGVLQPD